MGVRGPDPILDLRGGPPPHARIVNDPVMGGRSTSELKPGDGCAVFTGHVSLQNNGGFASVRFPIDDGALAGAEAVRIRVRGDDRRYELRLRPGTEFSEVAYGAAFDPPAGEWATVEMPLDAFEPSWRGRRPPDADPLDPGGVGMVAFMIKDGREGPFRLEIAWVAAVRGDA